MRNWYKFLILNKFNKNNNDDRFLFTNDQLINDKENIENFFNFENFKKNKVLFTQYNFLKNNLDSNKETLFIASSWGQTEFFLKDKLKIIASDIEDEYVAFHKKKTDLNYVKLDILDLENQSLKYEQIVVNNLEYLFNQTQLNKCIENISKISKPGAKIYVIFRSRDSFLIKLIDHIFTFFETYLIYLIKKIYKKVYFVKRHHGFRRSLRQLKKIWINNNFKLEKLYEDLYEDEYNRLRIIKYFKISYFISFILLRSNPYLNILIFKNLDE